MQNLVVFMVPPEKAFDTSLKDGNKFLNRFSIDEDAAFELLGVCYLKELRLPFTDRSKGKENLSLQ